MEEAIVLLVEDDDVDARAVERGFRKSNIGNRIVRVTNGSEALAILRGETGEPPLRRPNVVLLDLNMPGMNGFEFLDAVRADSELKSTVVFVLTTSSDARDLARAYDSCVAGYVIKAKAGQDFINLAQMLEKFEIAVKLPA